MSYKVKFHPNKEAIEFEPLTGYSIDETAIDLLKQTSDNWGTWLGYICRDDVETAYLQGDLTNWAIISLRAFEELKDINPGLAVLMLIHGYSQITTAGDEKIGINSQIDQAIHQGQTVLGVDFANRFQFAASVITEIHRNAISR